MYKLEWYFCMSGSKRKPPGKSERRAAPKEDISSSSMSQEGMELLFKLTVGAVAGGIYLGKEYEEQIKDFFLDNKEALIEVLAGAVTIAALGVILKMTYDSYKKHQAQNELTPQHQHEHQDRK